MKRIVLTICLISVTVGCVISQSKDPLENVTIYGAEREGRVIQTPVPFLNISPDSRGAAIGDAGVATSPDVFSLHWNAAKYPFIDNDFGVAISYTPWLRKLASDINLAYLCGYKKMGKYGVLSGSLRYFSLGSIVFNHMDQGQVVTDRESKPNEWAIDAAYSRLFSERFSGGVAFRLIRSDLAGGSYADAGTTPPKAGVSFAVDISSYYQKPITVSEMKSMLSFGINVSNIGTKMSYSENNAKQFLPGNLKLGSALKSDLDPYNSLMVTLDFNKLLVPTKPVTQRDSAGVVTVLKGKDDNVSVAKGIFQSFYDAPDGFKEELEEVMISIGAEYWYRNQFALRGGYFYENQYKGNRKYFTLGLGAKMNVFNIDFSYLVPAVGMENPLANTMRFSLAFNFDQPKKNQKK